jgi:hypothetical protein
MQLASVNDTILRLKNQLNASLAHYRSRGYSDEDTEIDLRELDLAIGSHFEAGSIQLMSQALGKLDTDNLAKDIYHGIIPEDKPIGKDLFEKLKLFVSSTSRSTVLNLSDPKSDSVSVKFLRLMFSLVDTIICFNETIDEYLHRQEIPRWLSNKFAHLRQELNSVKEVCELKLREIFCKIANIIPANSIRNDIQRVSNQLNDLIKRECVSCPSFGTDLLIDLHKLKQSI